MVNPNAAPVLLIVVFAFPCVAGPLEDYVNSPDDAYSYTIKSSQDITYLGHTYTQYDIQLYSQRWRTAEELNFPLWSHKMIIAIPHEPLTDMGLLLIEGGFRNMWIPPVDLRERMALIRAPFAMVLGVPNQPMILAAETEELNEDDLVAATLDKYLRTSDETWPILLPMVKTAVRAMDTVVEIAREEHDVSVNRFCVGGASKRGWTAWLTAAVDDRVAGVIPIVIDVLNMETQINHHFDSYGFYTSSIGPYAAYRIFERFWLPRGQALKAMIDPYAYLEHLDLPKFIICSPGDMFFPPDSSHFYFHDLPGNNLLRYVPNTDHGIGTDATVQTSITQYFIRLSRGQALPKITWELSEDNRLNVQVVSGFHTTVRLWQAHNPNARTFFYQGGSGIHYTSSLLSEETPDSGAYLAQLESPANGYSAFFVEVIFPQAPTLTTEVFILPDVLPYKPNINITDFSAGGCFEAGEEVRLWVETEGNLEPMSYRWHKDGEILDGAVQSELTLPALSLEETGYYACFIKEGLRRPVYTPAIHVQLLEMCEGEGETGWEADVAPRPDGDGALMVNDWVQVGRFVAGLDTPVSGSEFQRADCAPLDTAGDGQLLVNDWVQAGRYVAGLDAPRMQAGPTEAVKLR